MRIVLKQLQSNGNLLILDGNYFSIGIEGKVAVKIEDEIIVIKEQDILTIGYSKEEIKKLLNK